MSKWEPSPSDIEWTRNHINQISEGGIWVVPAANDSKLTFTHSTKSYDVVITASEEREIQTMMRILTVLKELGYLANSIIHGNAISREDRLNRFQNDNV